MNWPGQNPRLEMIPLEPPDHPRLKSADRVAQNLNLVLSDSWSKTLAFLKASLAN